MVTQEENCDLLRQNSTVVFLNREDLTTLAKSGRPLSQSKPVEQLALERMPLYRGWSDVTVTCVSPAEDAKNILEAVKFE